MTIRAFAILCSGLVLAVLLASPCLLSGQDLHSYEHFDVADGLTGSTVYCMAQDKDGFIWFGTETGLSRFDGAHFTNFSVDNGLPDNEVLNIFVDSRNRVWLMPFQKTIAYYWKGKIHNQQNDPMLARIRLPSKVDHIAEDDAGNILVVELRGGHIIRPDGTVEEINGVRGYTNSTYGIINVCAKKDSGFRVAFFGPGELALADLNGKEFLPYDTLGPSAGLSPLSCYMSTTEMTRMVHDSVMIFIDGEGRERFRLPPIMGILSLSHLNDSLFMINTSRYSYLLNTRQRKITDSFLQGQTVNSAMEDLEGNIWFSTLGNGIYRLGSTGIRNYSELLRGNYTRGPVFSIRQWDSTLYIGSEHFLLWNLNPGSGRLRSMRLCTDIGIGRVMQIVKGSGGRIIAGTDFGMYVFTRFGGKVRSPLESLPQEYRHAIKTLFPIGDSILLDCGNMAVRRIISHGSIRVDTIWKERATSAVWLQGNYYIGTLSGLYAVDENKKITNLGAGDPALANKITALAIANDGKLWIGTDGSGLLAYKDGKVVAHITRNSGLTSNVCRAIFADEKAIWLGTDRGLNKVTLSDTGYASLPFTKADGIGSDIINTVFVKNGDVFVGNAEGLVWFTEKDISRRSVCLLKVTSIAVSQRSWTPDSTGFKLPHSDNNIRVGFAGISFRSAGKIGYSYRLLGLDDEWRSTSDNFLSYPSLPSGSYELQLQAVNKFGVRSPIVSIRFSVEKLLWERLWLRLLLGLSITCVIWLIFNSRVRAIRRKEQEKSATIAKMAELEQMALRSQMNPHFIFNSLNSIQQYVLDRDVLNVNEFITKFSRLMRQTLDYSSRSQISLREEISYLATYLELEKTRFEDRFVYEICVPDEVLGQDLQVPPMILQPYVENAVRHGMGLRNDKHGRIRISVSLDAEYLICVVEDNGVGRETAARLKGRNPIQYQSQGMKLTEKRIGMFNQTGRSPVQVRIEDLEDVHNKPAGTRITVLFPRGFDI